jgi:iron complex outermembrane receptor protein
MPFPAGAAAPVSVAQLEDLSLEQLTQIRVTSVSRREERLADAPASIYVISAEDIRRSGATNIVDVLRLAPNLFVGRTDANQAVIGARGQYAGASNKMLVLIDGRTIYTPLFSGVFWDAQYPMVEDIERVEVISGPASTLWGTNGVNGVINITTRSARDTQGTLAVAHAGNQERGAGVRQGGEAGGIYYRAYAKYRQTDDWPLASGDTARDASERMLAGIRMDRPHANGGSTVEAEIYKGDVDNLGGDRSMKGGHVLGRWQQSDGDAHGIRLQAYYDRTERVHLGSFEEKLDILDLDLQHESRFARHHVVVGGGYRFAHDDIANTAVIGFAPARVNQQWGNGFVQDEWPIADGLALTAGLKAERNPYTGVEWLPNLRLSWDAAPGQFVWAALSRALRAPSRIDRDAFTPVLRTNSTFEAEVAKVVEVGYRAQLTQQANVSLTAFHQQYPNLRSVQLAQDGTGVVLANGFEGHATGLEGWGTLRVAPWWKLTAGFTVMSESFNVRAGYTDLGGVTQFSNDPRHTVQLRSSWDIAPAYELDVAVRNVGHIPNYEVPAYTVVDARLGWRVQRDLDVSLVLQDAFDRSYSEFGAVSSRSQFGRSWFIKVRWQT